MSEAAKQELDFLVIGAAKAGTSSLFAYLRQHPELALPPSKEAPYFSREATVAQGWGEYIDYFFGPANPARRWGTVTPEYMMGVPIDADETQSANYDEYTVPRRIRAQLPDVRLVSILRDPVERALSDHRMSYMLGRDSRPADEAFTDLLQPRVLESSRRRITLTNRYVINGEYGRILSAYFDLFPREQLLVVFAEELKNDPERVIRQIFAFVGVRHDIVPKNIGRHYNVGADKRWLSPFAPWAVQGALARNRFARAGWHSMSPAIRRRVLREFDGLGYRFWLWNRRKGQAREAPIEASPAIVERLRDHFREDQMLLSSLLAAVPPYAAEPDG